MANTVFFREILAVLKHILLVEDDEAIAQTLIFSLQREGWQSILNHFKRYVESMLN